MEIVERIAIERECQRLVTSYCHYVDHGEAAKIAELFTDDGEWLSADIKMIGKEKLRKGFAGRQANTARMSRHVCNNLLIDVIDEDNAEGVVYLTLYRYDGEVGRKFSPMDEQPAMVGEYRDKFVRTDEGWRFSKRVIDISFIRLQPAKKDGGTTDE
jgi:hypothetical protein